MKMTFYRAVLCAYVASCIIISACSKNNSSSPYPTPPTDPVVPLSVSSVSPSQGPANTSVTIYGTAFSDTMAHDSVFFNGVKAVLTAASKTQLVARVPLGAGTGKITVYINGTPVTGPVFTYDSSYVVSLLAGTSGTYGFKDGTGPAATFWAPMDVVTDANGNVYVADMANHAIRKITPNGVVTTLAGGQGSGAADGTGIGPFFYNVKSIAIDAAGTLYVCDDVNYKIRKVTQAGVVTTLAGGSFGFADGTGSSAKFSSLGGIGVDKNGNVYVSDGGNNRIRKITPAGVVTTLAGTGVPGANDGPGASATFNAPAGLAVDGSGNVYVSEGSYTQVYNGVSYPGNNKIRKIAPDGTVSTFAGNGTVGSNNGTGTAASFNEPYGLRFDSNGNLYVVEIKGNLIRKITPGADVSTFAGSIVAGATNGPLDVATFNKPAGIAIDDKGNFYVADFGNVLIRKISRQ